MSVPSAPSRPRPTTSTSTSSLPNPSVRRNLFQSQPTRRPTFPTPATTSTSTSLPTTSSTGAAASTSTDTLRLDVDVLSDNHNAADDIVVRDANGDIHVDLPRELFFGSGGVDVGFGREGNGFGEEEDEEDDTDVVELRRQSEQELLRLSEAVKHHQMNQNSVLEQPEELLEAVRESLRLKVDALADDDWMFAQPSKRRW